MQSRSGDPRTGDPRRDLTAATGEFPLSWPEMPDDPELPGSDDVNAAELPRSDALGDEETNPWDRHSLNAPPRPQPPSVRAPSASDLVSVFDSRPPSRGPEYHPPALPGASRERPMPAKVGTGTYRMGAPPLPSFQSPEDEPGEQREPSTIPPLERALLGAGKSRPLTLRGKRIFWAALTGLGLGTCIALGVVRVPVRAWGVLKASGLPESLNAGVTGTVALLHVAVGDEVGAGDAVLELHSPDLEANLESRRAELEALHEEQDAAAQEDKAALQRNLAVIERRRALLEQRLELKDAELTQRNALVDDMAAKLGAGSAPSGALLEPSAALEATKEERLALSDQLAQLELEANDRRTLAQTQERVRKARFADAEARLLQAQNALRVATVRAPAPGWIESMLVTRGNTVPAGAEIARFVPRSPPRSVLALLPLADAADVRPGEEASIEISPHSESSHTLVARVKHMSREVAPAARVQALLGGDAARDSFVQLELDLEDTPELHASEAKLRVGSRTIVSFATPHRRLGGVLFDALREWWDNSLWG
ncbi:MAG TPA: HlyD family efflux transporter periplasmic adaptor subunit [Polyangiaceae bacterium]|nr:HlyD family efflux transporter periplasmic adaptor subunit [Polyangiaceae bacterium]